MTGQDLVDRVKQQGFDNTDNEILQWADERQKEMVAAARARRKTLTIFGGTVAGQQAYDLPGDVVEVYEVSVDGVPYAKSPHSDIARAAQSTLVWTGEGLFIPTADDGGLNQIALLPIPEADDAVITIYAAVKADNLALGDTVLVDDEFVRYLVYGAIATGWDLNAEDGNTSERYEARFETGKEMYRRWVIRRFKGSGPAQIRVKGLNA